MKDKIEIYRNTDKKILKNFGLVMSIGVPLVFGLFLPLIFKHPLPLPPWGIGMFFFLASYIYPVCLKFIYIPWMLIGDFLGKINTTIILTAVFFLIVTPLSWVRKIFSNKLNDNWSLRKEQSTYRIFNKEKPIDMTIHMRRLF